MIIKKLPDKILRILDELNSPERLKAHLAIVYTVAEELVDNIQQNWPTLKIDKDLILLGAASHDIGKIKFKNELISHGKEHEPEGKNILKSYGFSEKEANFTCTHSNWLDESVSIEDLIVALADKCWKGKREESLENKIVEFISRQINLPKWEIFIQLDNIIIEITKYADQRLNWQNNHSL